MINKSRSVMINYLVNETRYKKNELNGFSDKKIEKWYKEEVECNREK